MFDYFRNGHAIEMGTWRWRVLEFGDLGGALSGVLERLLMKPCLIGK
jgi:hypothetical protein